MRRTKALSSALVRFVHARCGVGPGTDGADACLTGALREAPARPEDLAEAAAFGRPLVFRLQDLAQGGDVPAVGSRDWLPYLRKLCGHREVVVRLPRAPEGLLERWHSWRVGEGRALTFGNARSTEPYANCERRRLDDVLDELTVAQGRARCYLGNLPLEGALPELDGELRPLGELVGRRLAPHLGPQVPGTPSLYLGAGGQRTPLHFDPTENLTVLLQGSKLFRLFPPALSGALRPVGGALAAGICRLRGVVPAVYSDVDAWDEPEAGQRGPGWPRPGPLPAPLDVELQAGDILYLPRAWWHAVAGSQEPNLSVVFGFVPRSA